MAQGLRILGWTLSTLTPTCSSSSDLFPSSGPSLTVSYFLWFWHKHKRDEQKHERPPKAWAQNRNSAVSVHTLWPKADPMAKSSINEVGTLSPLVEVKGVDSCWEKSIDSKQECNMTLNRPQAFVQIHNNPRAILLMWLQNRAFLTPAYEIYWPGKEYIHQKKKSFESQVLQKRVTMVNELLESIVSLPFSLAPHCLSGHCRDSKVVSFAATEQG